MSHWFRVFGSSEVPPEPEAMVEHLRSLGIEVAVQVEADESGWYRAELRLPENPSPIELERYSATEEGIREELNTWAAWVESVGDSPAHISLMQHLIGARQLITVRCPLVPTLQHHFDRVSWEASRFLAMKAEGVYQMDRRGFHDADGKVLVAEE